MAGIVNWIRGKIGLTHPQVKPTAGLTGHRGMAVGTGTAHIPTKLNRRTFGSDEIDDFVYEQQLMFVNSSNVAMAQYFHTAQKMMVEFKGGTAYLYSGVSENEAVSFATAHSKGGWCWDHLRIRGSKCGHRKPYVRVKGQVKHPCP